MGDNCGCFGDRKAEEKLSSNDFAVELGRKAAEVSPRKQLGFLALEETGASTAEKSPHGGSLALSNQDAANASSSFFSTYEPNWEGNALADYIEFNGVPWSKLKVLRRDPAFNKREFLA